MAPCAPCQARETLEEAGLVTRPLRLIALLDRSRNNPGASPYSIQKAFVLSEVISGAFSPNPETLDSGFFPWMPCRPWQSKRPPARRSPCA